MLRATTAALTLLLPAATRGSHAGLRASQGLGRDTKCLDPPPPLRDHPSLTAAAAAADAAPSHLKYLGMDGGVGDDKALGYPGTPWVSLGFMGPDVAPYGTSASWNVTRLRHQKKVGVAMLANMHGLTTSDCQGNFTCWHKAFIGPNETVGGMCAPPSPPHSTPQSARAQPGGCAAPAPAGPRAPPVGHRRDLPVPAPQVEQQHRACGQGGPRAGTHTPTPPHPTPPSLNRKLGAQGIYIGDELLGLGVLVKELEAILQLCKTVWPEGITCACTIAAAFVCSSRLSSDLHLPAFCITPAHKRRHAL